MTTVAEARSAIEAHFTTEWAARTPVELENVSFTPPTSDPWIKLMIHVSNGEQITLGQPGERVFRSYGTVTVQLHTPAGTGLGTSYVANVQAAKDAFEGSVIGSSAVRTRNVGVTEIGASGGWHLTNISAQFDFDERR